MTTYYEEDGTKVESTSDNHVGQGGQAEVFAIGDTAYKVFKNPAHMPPVGKVQELSVLDPGRVVRPLRMLQDKHGKPVGYSMPFVRDRVPLVQILTLPYRRRNGVTPGMMHDLVQKVKDGLAHIHENRILVVDLNDWNLLTTTTHVPLWFIDSDSFETPSFPATAIAPGIQDWSANWTWSENTDWFSFGIISFQLLVGIHPFLGRYQGSEGKYREKLPTDDDDDDFAPTRRRMEDHISVFHPEVLVPKAFRYDAVPPDYLAWYKSLFVQGERTPPPDLGVVMIVKPVVRTIGGTANLDIQEFLHVDGDILGVWERHLSNRVIASTAGIWHNGRRVRGQPSGPVQVGFTPKANKPVLAVLDQERLSLTELTTGQQLPLDLRVREMASCDGRIYARGRNRIYEVIFTEMPSGQVVASTKAVARVSEHASRLYDGCAIQTILGSTFVSVFPRTRAGQQIRLEELDEYKVVDARYCGGVLMILGRKGARTDRLVFRFDTGSWVYDLRVVEDVSMGDLNFITLDSGVSVCLDENEELEVFSSRKGSTQMKVVQDAVLGNDMTLIPVAGRAGFYRQDRLYQMSMR